mmetsp:Transcript_11181/g.15391  ORF Transcript_11181/g.15391 Transcript_11181/m.15391 type:complete len:622 (+) Transcript_11181:61-1926(+)
MYGDLEGRNKAQVVQELGEDAVQQFRTGFFGRPPPMSPTHPHWHGRERKYSDLQQGEIPMGESLQDTMERAEVLWHSRIKPDLLAGKNVMVMAHGNSLRGIVKIVDNLTAEEITRVWIPNGIPLVFKFQHRNMTPIAMKDAVSPLSGQFLEKEGLLRAALAKEKELAQRVPGYEAWLASTSSNSVLMPSPTIRTQFDPILSSLNRLNYERELMNLAAMNGSVLEALKLTSPDRNYSQVTSSLQQFDIPSIANNRRNGTTKSQRKRPISTTKTQRKRISFPSKGNSTVNKLVIIRHGKTEYNKMGIFTGWEDAPLSEEGRAEARRAGKLLLKHKIDFDIVYTSWLSRAIETAWLVLDEMDLLWLPISKTWRLNERMYGALTGLSKSMIKEIYGDKQFKQWRRSYTTRPPATSSFSSVYPGNDDRYVKNVRDVRFSMFESLIRSISHGKVELHRKFPKTESLKDCMSRTIPYYTDIIVPNSIEKGKSVLISSSENAIRGLLMYLCGIPEDKINEVEIPTGLPLVYNFEKRCIQLLDDGKERENSVGLVSEYNFGSSPDLLFKPCSSDDEEDSSDDSGCFLDGYGLGDKSYKHDPIIRIVENDEDDYEVDVDDEFSEEIESDEW